MSVRDLRNAGWCWQEKAALRLLRCHYDGERLKQRSTALAVYLALTEAASNQSSQGQVEVIHLAIAEATGTSRSTVKRYLSEFEAIGLVAIERRKMETGTNLPNVYLLLNPPSTHEPQWATANGGVPSTHERQGSTDGLDQEETLIKNGPKESDPDFVRRFARSRGWTLAEASALAATHTTGGTLNRAAFLAGLGRR